VTVWLVLSQFQRLRRTDTPPMPYTLRFSIAERDRNGVREHPNSFMRYPMLARGVPAVDEVMFLLTKLRRVDDEKTQQRDSHVATIYSQLHR